MYSQNHFRQKFKTNEINDYIVIKSSHKKDVSLKIFVKIKCDF